MKTTLYFFRQAMLTATIAMILQSCGYKNSFLTSSVVPAAEGTVKIKNDKNSNYVIDLEVIRLAEPARLSPPKAVYVVWMQTARDGVKNIGQLKTASGFLSKTMKSSLKTVSPYEPTEIMITAESNGGEQYPGQVVLTTGSLQRGGRN